MTDITPESIGSTLRQRRLERGVTLETVTNALRIQSRFLKALEEDRWDELPAQVFLEGFLVKYADYLGLNGAVLRDQLRAKMGQSGPPAFTHPSTVPESIDDSSTSALRWILVGAAVLVVVAGALFLFRRQEPHGLSLAKPLNQVTEPETVVLSTAAPSSVVPSVAPVVKSSHSLVLRASESVWVRVRLDGAVKFEGTLASGEVRTWPFEKNSRVRAGNVSRLIALVDGKSLADSTTPGPADVIYPARDGRTHVIYPAPAAAQPPVAASTTPVTTPNQ
jgi:cytoskeleton protein RodZ